MSALRSLVCLLALAAAHAAAAEAERETPPAIEGMCECADVLKPLRDADPKVAALLEAYQLAPKPFPWKLVPKEQTPFHDLFALTFPSPVKSPVPENNTVHAEYYRPREPRGKSPAALVLHILDGRFLVARTVCRHLARKGTPALLVMMPFYGPRRPAGRSLADYYKEDPRRILDSMRATVIECRRAACWLQKRPEVDPDKIGVVGVSLGAIAAGLLAGVDPRFTRNVLVLGGGDPVSILWHAPETARVRDTIRELGFTREQIQELARDVDAIHFAKRVDPKTVLMINASADRTVPRDCTERLWEAMGKPKIQWLPGGHYSASLYIPVILPMAQQFVATERP